MPGPSLVDTFGAVFIGLLFSTVLFGLTLAQTWIYFWKYGNTDSLALKFFVAFVTFMDALHTILCAYSIYWYLVVSFGDFENLGYTMWAMNAEAFVSTILEFCVQFYYARRVYLVSKDIICPIVIVVLAAVSSSLGFLFVANETVLKQFSRLHSLTGIACAVLATFSLADLLIAASMCWSLYRKRTGFARTDSILISLMAYSVNTGLVSCLLALGVTISFVASPSSLIWVAIYWMMNKCYVNSLLGMLNSREYIRGRSTVDHFELNSENEGTSSSVRIEPSSDTHGSKSGQPGVTVTVHRSTRLDFGRRKSDHRVEPTFDVPKAEASIIAIQSQDRMSESNA